MNSIGAKIAAFALSLFMLAYVGYQVWLTLYDPYVTDIVYKEDYVQPIHLNGFFVRSEAVIDEPKTGVVGYRYQNAQKVAKDAVVASIYGSQNDLVLLRKISLLQAQRSNLAEAQSKDSSEGIKLDLLAKQISDYEMELVRTADQNDFSKLDATYSNLMFNLNKFNSYVNSELTFDSQITALDEQIQSLQGQISTVSGDISTTQSGYFSNIVDGLESELTPDMLSGLTIQQVEQVLKKQNTTELDSIGRIVTNETWYFVSLVSAKEAQEFTAGSTITLKFISKSLREIPVNVEKVITEKDNGQAAVVLSSNYLDENFVTMRFERPVAIVRSYSGIVIPKEAVRIRQIEDENGNSVDTQVVYVQVGNSVRYKLLSVIYEDDDIVVSKVVNESGYVAMYDQVILKGKDLHDTEFES